jgi:hypothetical protein
VWWIGSPGRLGDTSPSLQGMPDRPYTLRSQIASQRRYPTESPHPKLHKPGRGSEWLARCRIHTHYRQERHSNDESTHHGESYGFKGLALISMAPTCRHTDCGDPAIGVEAGGRYCEQHALELFAVMSMLDEMRHIPDQTPV